MKIVKLGWKESLAWPEEFLGGLLAGLLYWFLISSLVSSVVGNLWRYLAATLLVLPSMDAAFSGVVKKFTEEVRRGWSKAFGRPLSWFLFTSLRELGRALPGYLVRMAFGLLFLGFTGGFEPLGLLAILFCLLYDLSLAYLISGLAFFITETWGIRVYFVRLPHQLFGGKFLPSEELPGFLSGRFMGAALWLLGEKGPPLFPFLLAPVFFLLGHLLHTEGKRRFEAWGG